VCLGITVLTPCGHSFFYFGYLFFFFVFVFVSIVWCNIFSVFLGGWSDTTFVVVNKVGFVWFLGFSVYLPV